jgi:putative oxidoreductase
MTTIELVVATSRGDIMANERSSHPALSYADSIATSMQDTLLLVGRVTIGVIFFFYGFNKIFGSMAFSTRGWPAEWFFGPLGAWVELIGGLLLILGAGTRYAALLMLAFMIVATYSNHRYWTYPAAQQGGQQAHFFKNVAIFGGIVLVFVTGAGRYAIDAILRRK